MRTPFFLATEYGIDFTVDISVSTKQLWVCFPRGSLNRLLDTHVLDVVYISGRIKKQFLKNIAFKDWTIHA